MRLEARDDDGLDPIERVLPRLTGAKKLGTGGWSARCPAHDDKRPSLTVAVAPDGRILLNCHKGCSYQAIMAALELRESDGFPSATPTANGHEPPARAIAATYDYCDEQRNVLFQTVRYAPKDFRQRHQSGGEWVWSLNGIRRVLYRLPELIAADPSWLVWLVEGEKDADYLRSLGFVATTSPMGAKGWRPEYAEFLRGRHVVIVPDNDIPGRQYALTARNSLEGVAASCRAILLPGLPPGGDVSDWLDTGHTAGELAQLAERLTTDDVSLRQYRYRVHNASEAFEPIPPIEWVVDNLLARGSVAALVGAPGSKKTYTALDLAVCVAQGRPWLGRATVQSTVLLIDEESGNNRMLRRMRDILRGHKATRETPVQWTTLEMINLMDQQEIDELDRLVAHISPGLVIVDALADVMPGGDENSVRDTHPVMMAFRQLADRHNCAVAVIHHSNKMGGYRGSSAILGAPDLMLMIESTKESPIIMYKTWKSRDTEDQSFSAEINFDIQTNAVFLTTALVASQGKRRPASEEYILSYLRDAGGQANISDICNNASCCSAATAHRSIYRLAAEGSIRRVDGGKSTQMAVYAIDDKLVH